MQSKMPIINGLFTYMFIVSIMAVFYLFGFKAGLFSLFSVVMFTAYAILTLMFIALITIVYIVIERRKNAADLQRYLTLSEEELATLKLTISYKEKR